MKICIIGGGTAGWLAALMITRLQPGHKVTVIESSKIGIIGAGEGTTGIFFDLANKSHNAASSPAFAIICPRTFSYDAIALSILSSLWIKRLECVKAPAEGGSA